MPEYQDWWIDCNWESTYRWGGKENIPESSNGIINLAELASVIVYEETDVADRWEVRGTFKTDVGCWQMIRVYTSKGDALAALGLLRSFLMREDIGPAGVTLYMDITELRERLEEVGK